MILQIGVWRKADDMFGPIPQFDIVNFGPVLRLLSPKCKGSFLKYNANLI